MDIGNRHCVADARAATTPSAWEGWGEPAREWPTRWRPTNGELSCLEELDPRPGYGLIADDDLDVK